MGFKRKLKYFLVHTLNLNNKEAQDLIDNGDVEINGNRTSENCLLPDSAEIKIRNSIVQERKTHVYLKFNKPRGFESSLNPSVDNNLSAFFSEYKGLAIAGRLDKQSEGLLLLSDDGKWIERMCNPKFEKEKEYLVTLDKEPEQNFFNYFNQGVTIGDYTTQPCICRPIKGSLVKVVLKEGKNRQIRRMCKALGYEVTRLMRVRVDRFDLELLPVEKAVEFNPHLLM